MRYDTAFGPCSSTPVALLDEAVLLDLKHLLIEAKQIVPPFLLQLESDKERLLDIGGKNAVSRVDRFARVHLQTNPAVRTVTVLAIASPIALNWNLSTSKQRTTFRRTISSPREIPIGDASDSSSCIVNKIFSRLLATVSHARLILSIPAQ
jgi:hypothetical protein